METAMDLKQPPALKVLFFAELWERFGFYCMQALLVLFLTKYYSMGDKDAYNLFSAFSALIYATPILGGYLADRFIGFRRAIIIGAVLYLFGYFALASLDKHIFFFALSALIMGNGFFKANVSSLLGKLYDGDDPRRDSGFTLFYMGINIGSFLAPIICAFVAKHYGWGWGFASAGIGMIICLFTCTVGFKLLGERGRAPIKLNMVHKTSVYALIVLLLFGMVQMLRHDNATSNFLIAFEGFAFLALLVVAFFQPRIQRNKLIALIILMIFSIAFWAFYILNFSALILFTERNVNRLIFGYQFPTGMFASIDPFFIITLSPIFAIIWLKLNSKRSKLNPSTPMKFALALISMGLGFLVMAWGIQLSVATGLMAVGWLVLNYLFQETGELALSPIGLAAVTELAPPSLTGFTMGIWFISLSAAYAIGGKIADLTAIPKTLHDDPKVTSVIYQHNFIHFGLACAAVGVVLIFLTPWLKKMMHPV